MFIKDIEQVKHDRPLYALRGITNTLLHINSEKVELRTPFLAEFNKDQGKEFFRHQTAKKIDYSETKLSFSKDSVLIRRAPIDGAL